MARIRIASTSGASENTIVFSPAGGHSHNGRNSSLIDSTAYSIYDFSPTFVGTEVNPDRAVRQENNRIAFEDLIKRVVNNSVLAPAGIRLEPSSLNGSLIIANTITANQLAANTITAAEISAGTITANELSSNIVLINNRISSQNWNGTIQANGTIYSNGIGTTGWAITNTHAVFDSTLIRGSIAANSLLTPNLTISNTGAISSTSFNVTAGGNVTATNANITGSITSGSGTIGGWTIDTNRIYGGSTYLYSNGSMSIGATTLASNGQITNGNFTLSAAGALTATGANISGAIIATSGTFTGTINAAGGTIAGYLSSGGVDIGYLRPYIYSYYKGINLSTNNATEFTNVFMRGNGNEVYFRVDNGSQWIKFENGTVQIQTPSFTLNGSSVSMTGSVTAGSGKIGDWIIDGSSLRSIAAASGGQSQYISLNPASGIYSENYVGGSWGAGYYTQVKINYGSLGSGIDIEGNGDSGTVNTTELRSSYVSSKYIIATTQLRSSGTMGIGSYENESANTTTNAAGVYASQSGFLTIARNGVCLVLNGTATNAAASQQVAEFRRKGLQPGTSGIFLTSSAVSYATTSDYRLKENVASIAGAIDLVNSLNPVTFDWIHHQKNNKTYGFIAHELAEVVPDAVMNEKDGIDDDGNPKYQSVDTSFATPIIVAALKEAIAKIEELESRIQTLEGV